MAESRKASRLNYERKQSTNNQKNSAVKLRGVKKKKHAVTIWHFKLLGTDRTLGTVPGVTTISKGRSQWRAGFHFGIGHHTVEGGLKRAMEDRGGLFV